jgi:hypothetical protein
MCPELAIESIKSFAASIVIEVGCLKPLPGRVGHSHFIGDRSALGRIINFLGPSNLERTKNLKILILSDSQL